MEPTFQEHEENPAGRGKLLHPGTLFLLSDSPEYPRLTRSRQRPVFFLGGNKGHADLFWPYGNPRRRGCP